MIKIPLNLENTKHNQKMTSDILKVLTVTVFKEVVALSMNMGQGNYFSEKWIKSTIITVSGFLLYYLIISKSVSFQLNNK